MSVARLLLPVALVCLSFPAQAGFTSTLVPLATAVTARKAEVDGSSRSGRLALRALRVSERVLARRAVSLGDDLRALRKVAGRLRRPFRADAAFDTLLQGALDGLAASALADRTRLVDLVGEPADPADGRRLDRALERFDALFAKAREADSPRFAASCLRRGWREVAHAERVLGVGPLPDFSLADVNGNSATAGRKVSPRDYAGMISAYYFGHAT